LLRIVKIKKYFMIICGIKNNYKLLLKINMVKKYGSKKLKINLNK